MAQTHKRHGKRYNIDVTETDIANAKRSDSYLCVVSQAVAREIKDATRIDTDMQSIRFNLNDERLVFLTPYAVQGYIAAFDAGEEIQPFSFQLRDPHKVKRTTRTDQGKLLERAYNKTRPRAVKPGTTAHATAKDAYKAAQRAKGDAPAKTESKDGHRPPPKVFKKKTRTYGMRLLRINRPPAAETAPEV